jgi:hypothetical protein
MPVKSTPVQGLHFSARPRDLGRSDPSSGPVASLPKIFSLILGVALCAASLVSDDVVYLPARRVRDQFIVRAHVGIHGPWRLLIDTGASDLFLKPAHFQTLVETGLATPGGTTPVTTRGTREPLTLPRATVREIQLGSWIARDVEMLGTEFAHLERMVGEPLDGVAGLSVFRGGRLRLDPSGFSAAVEPRDQPLPTGSVTYAFDPGASMPVIGIRVADRTVPLLVDTGFAGSFSLPWAGLPWRAPPAMSSITGTAAADVSAFRAARLGTNITVAGLSFEAPVAEVSAQEPGLMGTEVLRHFALRIDGVRREVTFTPRHSGPVGFPAQRNLGVAFSPEPSGLRVEALVPEADAASHLKPGDVITRLNGLPAAEWSHHLPAALAHTSGVVRVEFRRGATTAEKSLRVMKLFEEPPRE